MKDNSGKVLLALLAGASAGVIAGLLMAPDTGEATRGSVKKWAGKLSKDLESNLQAGLDEIKNMSTDAYNKVSSAAGVGSSGGSSNTSGRSSAASSSGSGSGASSTGAGSTTGGGSTGGGSTSAGGNSPRV
ncbi:YtxH domain-containing protein [Pontibacter sp. 172403-2]|uniref:YtxH domain-containing protein n=1 Tax=Pontibacter rufus TaxID=2791028 RepID=UPI0018AFEEF6|nr:YtxH domain-containing protein [Pontibacter sp. 172403-2]MBF9252091.1 YtxH domain-containing protein [Pontibacter sp. 172403-2]